LALAVTATIVTRGWARIHQRHRLLDATMTASATNAAHATCTEGIAESWSAMPVPIWPYTDCP